MVLLFTNYYKYAQYSHSNVKIQVQVQIHSSIKQQEETVVGERESWVHSILSRLSVNRFPSI